MVIKSSAPCYIFSSFLCHWPTFLPYLHFLHMLHHYLDFPFFSNHSLCCLFFPQIQTQSFILFSCSFPLKNSHMLITSTVALWRWSLIAPSTMGFPYSLSEILWCLMTVRKYWAVWNHSFLKGRRTVAWPGSIQLNGIGWIRCILEMVSKLVPKVKLHNTWQCMNTFIYIDSSCPHIILVMGSGKYFYPQIKYKH